MRKKQKLGGRLLFIRENFTWSRESPSVRSPVFWRGATKTVFRCIGKASMDPLDSCALIWGKCRGEVAITGASGWMKGWKCKDKPSDTGTRRDRYPSKWMNELAPKNCNQCYQHPTPYKQLAITMSNIPSFYMPFNPPFNRFFMHFNNSSPVQIHIPR
jgi:hypothetical protein